MSLLIIQIAVFAAVVLLIVAASLLFQTDPFARRIEGGTRSSQSSSPTSVVYENNRSKAIQVLEPFQRRLAQSDQKQVGVVRRRLIQAGYYAKSAIEVYFTLRVVLAIGLAIASAIAVFGFLPPMGSGMSLLLTMVAAAFGYYLPSMVLAVQIKSRQDAFRLGMPDAMDMILVGVEAGLSLPAAINQLCSELAEAHPVIVEQFNMVLLEFQAGRSRAEALSAMSRRVDIAEARTFSTMIIQSEALGTSLAQTLRTIANEIRTNRMLTAEKRAAELPVKMAVPLVLLIFPALFSVIMTPLVIRIAQSLPETF